MRLPSFSSPFIKARVTLTLWYCLILIIILAAFSTVLYTEQTRDYGRIIIYRNFNTSTPRLLTPQDVHDIQGQVRALRKSFRINLLMVDILILIGGGGLGYMLAGKTLEPIQKNMEQQKKFIADASHELRTPLAAITTSTEVALRSKDKTKLDYRKVIDQTHEESTRMAKLVDELLTLTRVETGMIKINFASQRLDVIAENVLEEIQPLLARNHLHLQKDIQKNVLVKGDADRLKQLILIFLDNAIKYTGKGGTVSLLIKASPRPTLSVEDTGIGMKPEDKERIFDRFYQADTSRTGNGAGLGLSIAKWILEAHKATVTISTKLRKGTKITVSFPNV